ncbi:MAG: TlpA family protein disulfide reductase [Pelagibacterales bacterium]|nr:TlpA family protein disulfide reductase [Pelagibacterales bacterium]
MSSRKVISLQEYKKSNKLQTLKNKLSRIISMLFAIIVVSVLAGSLLWDVFVENPARLDVQIPKSNDITFNDKEPIAMTTAQIANQFDVSEGKPILLYIYTTWCSVCSKQFPIINEIAREFQNTEMQVIALAIDKNLTSENLKSYLSNYGDFYFEPRYLVFKDGFLDLLKKKNIPYNGRIPFTALISQHGEVITKFTGVKSENYLRNKIIKEIYQ